MTGRQTLWALERATPETLAYAGALAEALGVHIMQSGTGLTSVLMQIG